MTFKHFPNAMLRILKTPLGDEEVSRIQGNAERNVKERAARWLDTFHAPPRCFAGSSSRGTKVIEVSMYHNPLENALVGTMVNEINVTEEMLDDQDHLSSAFIVLLIDECATAITAALDLAKGGLGVAGVSQSLNTVFHESASLGARIRIINTTLTSGLDKMSCRSEVWDLSQKRLVASGVFVGMFPSPKARL
ncbi:hypothetical protein C8J57DRAFT_1337267 [Mycena rebaudengoi]|nr:hypothetical protein C8J57DRAFT_1337267 [Mycena rebaudengoi]